MSGRVLTGLREDHRDTPSVCVVWAAECQRDDGMQIGDGRRCHCMGKAGEVLGEGESCKVCWNRELGTRRFDGAALNRETIPIQKVPRSSSRGHPIVSMDMHSDVK